MERDPKGPYHLRSGVESEAFIEREVFYAQCLTCGWHSDFDDSRDTPIQQAWNHEYQMSEHLFTPHKTTIMRCIMLSQPDMGDDIPAT